MPLRKRRPDLDIPPDVEAVCLRAMEKDRDKRYADMDSFYRALGAAGGLPFEPSNVFVAPKASLRYPALAQPNSARDSRTAIAVSGRHGTFEDERPGRTAGPGGGLGSGAKVALIAAGVALLGGAAFMALRGGAKPEPAKPAAASAAPVPSVPPPAEAAKPESPKPEPVVAKPESPAKPEAESGEAGEGKPSRTRRKKVTADEPKVDPAHRQIPLPPEDNTPAELKKFPGM